MFANTSLGFLLFCFIVWSMRLDISIMIQNICDTASTYDNSQVVHNEEK